jgi:hypothetical protein
LSEFAQKDGTLSTKSRLARVWARPKGVAPFTIANSATGACHAIASQGRRRVFAQGNLRGAEIVMKIAAETADFQPPATAYQVTKCYHDRAFVARPRPLQAPQSSSAPPRPVNVAAVAPAPTYLSAVTPLRQLEVNDDRKTERFRNVAESSGQL